MHDEVFEAAQESTAAARDNPASTPSAASSPSEAYANLSLESREPMAADADHTTRTTAQPEQSPRPPPRSSSPAKRLHSDMDDAGQEQQGAPAGRQPSTRAVSVDMLDAASATDSTATMPSGPQPPSPPDSRNAPSLDEQVAAVMALHMRNLQDGQVGYVTSERWLARVFARTSENKMKPEQFDKSALEGEIGPVDNSDLVDTTIEADKLVTLNGEPFVPLRPGPQAGNDFEILPEEAWRLVVGWYGLKPGVPAIKRYVNNTAVDESSANLQYELYPPIFTIRKVVKNSTGQKPSTASPKVVASRSHRYMDFLKAAKGAAGINLKNKVRVWRVLNTAPADPSQPSAMLTPDSSHKSSRAGSPAPGTHDSVPLAIDIASFTALAVGAERELVMGKDETANEKYNGNSNLHITGLAEDQVLILEEQDQNGKYLTETSTNIPSTNEPQAEGNKAMIKASKGVQSANNSGRNSPASSMMTRGRTRNGHTRGTVGLTNLGNTCYMNSALQCIRSVEELSCFFLNGNYKSDLNEDNPLGHGGSIAKAYAGLVASIYTMQGSSSYAPRNFKTALGRAAPLFSGYGQQDSQEFLSFLVDGLHEDLNRVKKKPYTENPESDDNTVHDPEAIKALGEKFREIHRARNDSVAMDLFNGFYKNTMVCPDCDKVSITFDPFSLVTLQLPVEQTWQHVITFVPLRGSMVNIEIDIDKNATIRALKEYIAKRCGGTQPDRLMGAEVYNGKFYKVLEDDKTIAETNIQAKDDIFFYEVDDKPTNWPPRKKKGHYKSMMYNNASSEEDIPKSPSPLADKMLVPIFHRTPFQSQYRTQQWKMVLPPSYILLTRKEAKDYNSILKKVLSKVAQMTTRRFLTEPDGTSGDLSRHESDIVLTTEEDALPNGDPRVHDGSVSGEDNMVEVTMSDSNAKDSENTAVDEMPQVLKPGTFVPEGLQKLFDIKFTRPGKEMVPSGWSSVDVNKSYDPITKRIRVPATRQYSEQSVDGDGNSNASSSEETDDAPQFSAGPQSFDDQQSSEEEVLELPHYENHRPGGRANSKKNKRKEQKSWKNKKGQQHQSKKGKSRVPEQSSQSFSDAEYEDDEALVRLGEGLVLDWRPNAHDALFGGNGDDSDDQRGTYFQVETLEDQELEEKRAKRAQRKKNGITLDECFAETSKSEVLSEDNAWYCNRCKELRRATKTLEIWTAPDVLVIHLKRFSSHRAYRDKIEVFVDCPLEGLDLTKKVNLPEGKSLIYDLFAVDNHYGGLGGGHYTACCKSFVDGQWYDYNDSQVTQTKRERVVTKAAYLLFYRRRSDRPLGPPYLQKVAEQHRGHESDSDNDNTPDANNRDDSPAGNGLRLGDSSRNGSSSGFAAGAGALQGAGLTSAANLPLSEAAAATAGDDSEMLEDLPPAYDDEGFADGNDGHLPPLYQGPQWSFGQIGTNPVNHGDDDEAYNDAASDVPNMGSSMGAEDIEGRMIELDDNDFNSGLQPRSSTPVDDIILDGTETLPKV